MKIYKEKQFLIFDFEDGKTVKYDFATKTCIGKRGNPVGNLCSQLRGLTIDELCNSCVDEQYGKFLKFVQRNGAEYGCEINNIGTILSRVSRFAKFEQIFSAGIEDIVSANFSYGINDIPKSLIKICKTHNIKLSNQFLQFYKQNTDAYFLAYNLDYISLDDEDIYNILNSCDRTWDIDTWGYKYYSRFIRLLNEYGYTAKALLAYMDYLKTFEALEIMDSTLREIEDYAKMMKEISPKFDKYPRHFLTTHRIATRNYNRLRHEFDEKKFQNRVNTNMEHIFEKFCFIYPKCIQDIKDESVQMSNCVSSYVQKVIDGQCDILFLRYKDSPDKSLVTIEVRNGIIVQALQKYNHPLTVEQQEVVDKWNKWYANKIKNKNNLNNESEE